MWQAVSYYMVLMFEALLGVFGIRLYEEPRYQVIDRIGDRVEIRRYAPRLAAEVVVPLAGDDARSQAFRLLFAYIAGANRAAAAGHDRIAMTMPVKLQDQARIAMTVPVRTAELQGRVRMQFFLPSAYRFDNAPTPLDARVGLVQLGTETAAILRFSGTGRDAARKQSDLLAKLEGSRWRPAAAPYTLFYDAPFTLPFLRRNEAAVPVIETR